MSVLQFPPRPEPNGNGFFEPWVSTAVLARHFGVGERTIRNWRAAGMPSEMFGGSRRYRISESEGWHRENRRAS